MLTNNKSAVISNKNENVLTIDTKAVYVKVERSDDEVQQSEIDLYTYNVTKEEMAARHDMLQNVDRSNCSKAEPLPKKPRLDTQDTTTEPDNTAKGTRTETNTEEMTPKDRNENTEPSDTEPMENVTNKIPTKTSKPHNNTQKIRNDKNNKNVFQCNVCAKQYSNKADLAQHVESHDKTKRDIYFKCKECTYQSLTQCSLERHLKLHDKSRRFVCDVCGYRYTGNAHLQRHFRNVHSDEKNHECGICNYKTNYLCDLNRHFRIHSGEKPYSCSQCEFKSSDKTRLKIHRRIHTGEKPYSCCECNYKCAQRNSLKHHLRTHSESLPKKPRLDTQDKNTEPDNTAKGTRTETNTEEMKPKDYNENTEPSDSKPIENVTNKIPTKTSKPRNKTQRNIRNDKSNKRTRSIFQCNVKQYDKKPDLAQHVESHDKTKRDIYFKCKECTYQSVTQCSLERHLQLHDKSRRFVCDVCGYRFMDKAHLQDHLRNIHSDEKIHECCICDYKTNFISNLNKHLRIHTGEKPYSCSECNYKCATSSNLKLHLRTHTK